MTSTTYTHMWALTVHPNGWVTAATHLPSMATYKTRLLMGEAIRLAAWETLLAHVATQDDMCKACSRPYAEYRTYHFCQPCLAVAPNYKEGSL